MTGPRVAILGLVLESNRWSRPAGDEDFTSKCWLEGEAILEQARASAPNMPLEAAGFVRAMDATGRFCCKTGLRRWANRDSVC